jgi:hypothetical protein
VPWERGPPALDKSRINGLKDSPGALTVMGQTEAPPKGPKTVEGQAPPRDGVVPSWRRDRLKAHLMRRPATTRRGPVGGVPSP